MSNQNYSTGRYGVVDVFYRNIWMNHEDESIAHSVRKAFESKAGLAVYDLSIFDNFSEDPPSIDSDCCLEWQIDIESNSSVTKISKVAGVLDKTQTHHSVNILVNLPATSLLSLDRQKELQKQMMLYAHILKETDLHRLLDKKKIKELQDRLLLDPTVDYTQLQFDFYQKLDKIFAKELFINDINYQLRQLADQMIAVPTKFTVSTASKILVITGGIYA
jgi:hypothetical protein